MRLTPIMPAMRSLLLGLTATAVFVATTHGQSILGPPSEANHFVAAPEGWVHPKTPWGEPDLQGVWGGRDLTVTPLERPKEYAGRQYLTDEEVTAKQQEQNEIQARKDALVL